MRKKAILVLVLASLLMLAVGAYRRSRSCAREGAFTVNGYVPVQCGPFKPGERVDIEAHGEDGNPLDAGWPNGISADSTGTLRAFVTTIGWPAGNAQVSCRGRESGMVYRVRVPVTEDFEGAIRLPPEVSPAKVSLSRVGDAGVYVRVTENGFRPSEPVTMTVEGPDGGFSLDGQADWAGNVVFLLEVEKGDPPGVWGGERSRARTAGRRPISITWWRETNEESETRHFAPGSGSADSFAALGSVAGKRRRRLGWAWVPHAAAGRGKAHGDAGQPMQEDMPGRLRTHPAAMHLSERGGTAH